MSESAMLLPLRMLLFQLPGAAAVTAATPAAVAAAPAAADLGDLVATALIFCHQLRNATMMPFT
jgi:hypothetical protein